MDAGAATNWWGEIGKSAIALAAGYIGAVALEKYKARKSKPSSSAAYLEAVASALETVSNKLESNTDANLETHTLFHLIRGFRTGLRNLVDTEMLV